MVIAVCGKPGSGKTLFCTYLLKKHFYKENNYFIRHFKKDKIFNNCFSNYPVNLYKDNYSNQVQLLDFKKFHKWKMDSNIVIDEVQAYFDSMDYKLIPRPIAINFQFHRHFGIDNIYIVSQDPSRIPKYFRILAQEYYQIKKHFIIPFLGIAIFKYTIWNREEDYNLPSKLNREQKKFIAYDYKNKIKFFRYKKIYKSYDTKYLRALVDNQDYLDKNTYQDLNLTKEEILTNFPAINNNYDLNQD